MSQSDTEMPKVPTSGAPAKGTAESGTVPATARLLEPPRGAMLVMRVSGGIRFTTQEMAVYPDGRVTSGAGDTAKVAYHRAQRSMADAYVVRLRRMLDQSGFYDVQPTHAEPSPDGYAYEIVARVGSKHNHIEVYTGTMPSGIQALVDFLMKWMPAAEEG